MLLIFLPLFDGMHTEQMLGSKSSCHGEGECLDDDRAVAEYSMSEMKN